MGFFSDEKANKPKRSWSDVFITLTQEHPTVVQFVEPKVTGETHGFWKHYIPQAKRKNGGRGVNIVCPGISICPVCQRNKEVGKESPDYIAANRRYSVNVLDLTPRKKCPLCETESFTGQCSYCGTDLKNEPNVEPKVKLLERGRELFDHFETIWESTTAPYEKDGFLFDPEGYDYSTKLPGEEVPIGITHYPIKLVVGSNKKPTPVAGQVNDTNWRDYVDQYVNKEEAYIVLEPKEIQELLRGGSLSEVLKARYGESTEKEEIAF